MSSPPGRPECRVSANARPCRSMRRPGRYRRGAIGGSIGAGGAPAARRRWSERDVGDRPAMACRCSRIGRPGVRATEAAGRLGGAAAPRRSQTRPADERPARPAAAAAVPPHPPAAASPPVRLALLGSASVQHLAGPIRVAALPPRPCTSPSTRANTASIARTCSARTRRSRPLRRTTVLLSLDARHCAAGLSPTLDDAAATALLDRRLEAIRSSWDARPAPRTRRRGDPADGAAGATQPCSG